MSTCLWDEIRFKVHTSLEVSSHYHGENKIIHTRAGHISKPNTRVSMNIIIKIIFDRKIGKFV